MVSDTEEVLLRTALGDPSAAVTCEEWLGDPTWLNDLNPNHTSYLPLIDSKLHTDNPKLRGLRRFYWVRNRKFSMLQEEISRMLGERGVQAIKLNRPDSKGSAEGLRPLKKIHILVEARSYSKALAILRDQGWQGPPAPVAADLRAGLNLRRDGLLLRLSWHAYSQSRWDEADRNLRDRAQSDQLSETDWVLLRLLEGASEPNSWWILDLIAFADTQRIDWEQLFTQAQEWRRISLLRAQLRKAERFGLRTPSGMDDFMPTFLEKLDMWCRRFNLRRASYYLERCPNSLIQVISGIPRYLRIWISGVRLSDRWR